MADPEFEVVSAGLGSMLHVRLPQRSELYAAPGAAVGSSAEVSLVTITPNSLMESVYPHLVQWLIRKYFVIASYIGSI